MPDITLATQSRTEFGSRPSGRLRRAGQVPAVVYGLGADPVSVTVPARDLQHILAGESGSNTLITLDLAGEPVLTLARQIQRHPTRGELVHVDFVRIRRDVAVSAEIPVHLEGEAIGVRDGGLLEQLVFHLPIEAMPADIPVEFRIQVAELVIGDQLRVSDITLPPGVTTGLDPDTVVVVVAAPRGAGLGLPEEEEGAEPAEGGEPEASAAGDSGE
jgi:large subunit ribosomal protein L25